MKTQLYITQTLIIVLIFFTTNIWGQESVVDNHLRDNLMVYYVEDPQSDEFTLLNYLDIVEGRELFGGNPEMETAQALVRTIFSPDADQAFHDNVIQALNTSNDPTAFFIYFDTGPVDEVVASANWTNCLDNGRFTACVTRDPGDDYDRILHYGANLINSDGLEMAKNRFLSLLGGTSGDSAANLDTALQEGITMTFYTEYVNGSTAFTQNSHNEFERHARLFSRQHNAVLTDGDNIIVGRKRCKAGANSSGHC